jgi:D-lyxose ketol-isomerase
MRRSEINAALRAAQSVLDEYNWSLPAWGYWTAKDFAADPASAAYLRSRQLGWDVTDFGLGRFSKCGLILFCLRNGLADAAGEKTYAEKLLIVGEGQLTPTHRHKAKMEDIINRAGGTLIIEFSATDAAGNPSDAKISVPVDGIARSLRQWEPVELRPGESVTIRPGLYHRFYAKPGDGLVLAGEVSQVNDDRSDNFFLEPVGRFSDIEEDEPPIRPLWNEGAA